MQFSDSVIAAMIGAIATVSTALFQLFSALRSRNKLEVRPKKGRTMRSVVAVIALMIASGVGGYLYAGLRQQGASEDLRTLREELNAKLQTLAATTERLMQARDYPAGMQTIASSGPQTTSVESVLYAPACETGVSCSETTPRRTSLCGAMPSAMQVSKVELFAKAAGSQASWEQAAAAFEQDIGGGKFTGTPTERASDELRKTVCVDFLHWNAEPLLARVVLQYAPAQEQQRAEGEQPSAVAAMSAAAPATSRVSVISSGP
jgi:hypothetical protein